MGRLEEIVARNKHPGRHRKGVSMGILVAIFVFVILILMIFTDLDERPDVPKDVAEPAATEKRVNGVLLYREKARDAGVGD